MPTSKFQDAHSEQFISALEQGDVSIVRSIPKTELHSHGNLAFHAYDIGRALGVVIPAPPLKFKSFSDFIGYIRKYLHPLTDTQQELEYILFHSVEMAVEDGVSILEMSIDAKFMEIWPSNEHFFEFLGNLVHYFKDDIKFYPELGINRGEAIKDLERWAIPCIHSGLFKSIDLYGDEFSGSLYDISDIYKEASGFGLKLKAHSGEYGDSRKMMETIEILKVTEIQHGIAAAADPDLMSLLIERNIPLHICPTSNVALCRVDKIENHPIKKLFHRGVFVTINSDDIAVFDQTVSQEYCNLSEAGVLTPSELDEIRIRALLHFKRGHRYR